MPDTLVLAVNNPVIVSLVHSLGACWRLPAAVRGLLKMRFSVIQMETIKAEIFWNIQKSFEIGPYEAFILKSLVYTKSDGTLNLM